MATGSNGRIYALGGRDNSAGAYPDVFEYNPATNTWTTRASMPGIRGLHGVAEANGKVYALGGCDCRRILNSVVEYDPITDKGTKLPNMPTARWKLAATATDSTLYAIGGAADMSAQKLIRSLELDNIAATTP